MSGRSARASAQRSTRSRDEADGAPSSRKLPRRARAGDGDDDDAADDFQFTAEDADGGDDDRSSGGRGGRRSGRQSYSLTQPALPSSSRARPSSASADNDSIDFIVEGDDADAAASHAGDHLHPSASASSSSSRLLSTSPVDPNSVELAQGAQDWLRPLSQMTEKRHRDPLDHQSKRERILVRSMLHTLITHTRKDQEILNEDDGIRRAIKLADHVNRAVLQVTEELQDADEMQALASKGHEKARKQLQSDKSFDLGAYLDALMEQYKVDDKAEDSQEIDWVRLGQDCEMLAYTARVTSFVRGAFFHQSAAKAKRARRERVEEELKATSATAITSDEGLVAKQTQVRQAYVQHRIKQLTRARPVMVWRLLLDPTSFVRSVENFFDFSFAVKAGVVRFSFRDWDKQMAFPLVSWRTTEAERSRERKAMKALVKRIRRKLERSSQGLQEEEEEAELSQKEREDRAAERRARRARKEGKMQRLLERLKALDWEDREVRTARVKASIALQRVQAKQDADPHNFGHFTPVLDHPTWTGMVIKLQLQRPLIPPMTEEDERLWAQKVSHRQPTDEEGKQNNHIELDGGDDHDAGERKQKQKQRRPQVDHDEQKNGGDDEGRREEEGQEEEVELKEQPAVDEDIEFLEEQ